MKQLEIKHCLKLDVIERLKELQKHITYDNNVSLSTIAELYGMATASEVLGGIIKTMEEN